MDPSDRVAAIGELGESDVAWSVVSMSGREPDGDDAAYLRWHLLDHLPEQHRLAGLRHGRRFVSTPACRDQRLASDPAFDGVDHLVQYLFAGPVDGTLDRFFALGGALRGAGRMPMLLPRVHLAGWSRAGAVAADRVLVGASVLPWRPATGVFVLVEALDAGVSTAVDDTALTAVPGVAGVWSWAAPAPGTPLAHERFDATDGLALTICELDDPPPEVAPRLADVLAARAAHGRTARLAAPFEAVVPGAWDRHLP